MRILCGGAPSAEEALQGRHGGKIWGSAPISTLRIRGRAMAWITRDSARYIGPIVICCVRQQAAAPAR
jgi:hypothetical protein